MDDWADSHAIEELIAENRYRVTDTNKYLSRCIDGRYKADDLEPLAIPGADAGEMAIFIAASVQYNIAIHYDKACEIFIDLIGGFEHMRFHTDSDAPKDIHCGGCGHMKLIRENPEVYGLGEKDITYINEHIIKDIQKGALERVVTEERAEKAVLILQGTEFSIHPSLGRQQVFVFHKGLADARHRELCKRLTASKAVDLPAGCDAEYFYEVISEVTDDHLMETAKHLAQGLPIYSVNFKKDGSFKLESLGKVAKILVHVYDTRT